MQLETKWKQACPKWHKEELNKPNNMLLATKNLAASLAQIVAKVFEANGNWNSIIWYIQGLSPTNVNFVMNHSDSDLISSATCIFIIQKNWSMGHLQWEINKPLWSVVSIPFIKSWPILKVTLKQKWTSPLRIWSNMTEKSQKYMVSYQYWSRFPENHKATETAFNVGPSSARQRNAI